MKILANDGIAPNGKSQLEAAGFTVVTEKVAQEDLPAQLPDYVGIIVRSATKVRKDLIDACPDLKFIARAGVGIDNIDHEYARSKGIPVINTPAASSESVAELVFSHFFNLARSVHRSNVELQLADSNFKALKKSYSKGIQLRGKTLVVIGFGRIGREVARIGLGMGMRILPVDPMIEKAEVTVDMHEAYGGSQTIVLETVPLSEALPQADFLTLHVPTVNKPILGAEELATMKPTAFVVNSARGGVIEESALLHALESGQLGGAGLDVFVGEPTPDRKLLEHPMISITPHTGASTVEAQANIGQELADKIIALNLV
ncbi:MAG: D-2-hydroxyacid dehydrogenase [Bacteroidota bacterium]